jgi:hypothetical protein
MAGLTQKDIGEIFVYHDKPGQLLNYQEIRRTALGLANMILEKTPPSAEQTLAIRYLQQAVMFANAAIAHAGGVMIANPSGGLSALSSLPSRHRFPLRPRIHLIAIRGLGCLAF